MGVSHGFSRIVGVCSVWLGSSMRAETQPPGGARHSVRAVSKMESKASIAVKNKHVFKMIHSLQSMLVKKITKCLPAISARV